LKRFGLLAVAVVCAIAGFAAVRFDYELCHRGIPIAWVAIGLPIAGLVAGVISFIQRHRSWTGLANIVAAIANAALLVEVVMVMQGAGYLSC
jgi:hypothetical protein